MNVATAPASPAPGRDGAPRHSRNRWSLIVLLVAAAVFVGSFLTAAILDAGGRSGAVYYLPMGVGTVALLTAWLVRVRVSLRTFLLVVLIAGFAARLAVVWTAPVLSDDLYRYLWDGKIQQAGINPYLYPPGGDEVESFRDQSVWPEINRKNAVTIYPGVAQWVFLGARTLGIARPVTWKLLLLGVEALAVGLLLLVLRASRAPPWLIVVYAWNPLAVLAFAEEGHLDAFVLLALVGAMLAWQRGHTNRTGFLLGLAGALKLYPLLVVPAFLRDRSGKLRWKPAVIAVAVTVIGYLPYLPGVGFGVRGFLTTDGYLRQEGYVSGRRFVLASTLGIDGVWLAVAVGAVVALWALLSRRPAPAKAAGLYGAALLLTTPYPWYGTTLLAVATVGGAGLAGRRPPTWQYLVWPLFGVALEVTYVSAAHGFGLTTRVQRQYVIGIVIASLVTLAFVSWHRRPRPVPGTIEGPIAPLTAAERQQVTVVMPALNEADALPAAMDGRPPDLMTVVVDNGSTDATSQVAADLGVRVVVEPERGFGAACYRGLQATDTDVVVYCDADATFGWDDIQRVAAPVVRDQADLVLSWRRPDLRELGAMPWHVGIANRVLGYWCTKATGTRLHDLGPLRAISRTALEGIDPQDRTYGWPLEMVLRAGQADQRVREVPVAYRRRAGVSKVTGRPLVTARVVVRMLHVGRQVGAHRRPRPHVHPVGRQPEQT